MIDLQIKNLSFCYDNGLENLKDINLNYCVNDFLAIIGPNGGGKSTLLKLILGLLEPSSGEILIFGNTPKKSSNSLGYVPQNFISNPNFPLRVLDLVLMAKVNQKIFGFYSKDDKNFAYKALEQVGILNLSDKKLSDLSGGQRQRAYIARALCSDCKILLLDEPTASIDARGQAEIYMLLSSLNKIGMGIILVSHDVNLSLAFANKVAYVNKFLHLHDINENSNKQEFIRHLSKEHNHFCDVELALSNCGCDNA